jgi:hypothetical protein
MVGGNTQESHCRLGFGENKLPVPFTDSYDNLAVIIERSMAVHKARIDGRVSIQTIDSGDGKTEIGYCAGHRCLTAETLYALDPHYKERGMKLDKDGILRNLHGSQICFGCDYNQQKNER